MLSKSVEFSTLFLQWEPASSRLISKWPFLDLCTFGQRHQMKMFEISSENFMFAIYFLFFGQSESLKPFFGEDPKLRFSDQSQLKAKSSQIRRNSCDWSEYRIFGYSTKIDFYDSDWANKEE